MSGLIYPSDALVVKDIGFQGYEPPDTQTLQPKKKPRGRELHPIQKTINHLISRVGGMTHGRARRAATPRGDPPPPAAA